MRTIFWSTVGLLLGAILLSGPAHSVDHDPHVGQVPPAGDGRDPLVPPIIEALLTTTSAADSQQPILSPAISSATRPLSRWESGRFEHGRNALFHPHGERVCASGCAASRHPTEQLSPSRFRALLASYEQQPAATSGPALDELLYYGAQTEKLLHQIGTNGLSGNRAKFLTNQLAYSHARIAIRVIDESGRRRSWLEPTIVPLDRRHVFEMQTDKLQPLVTSGTVKRVGLDYLWTRL